MNSKKIKNLWEKNRKEVMKRVHRANGFGQSQTQISIFPDEIRLSDQVTPAYTKYGDMEDCLFAFDIRWDPFISYDDIDDIFETNLDAYQDEKNMEKEMGW